MIQRLDASCPDCGSTKVQHMADLKEGDAVYGCGACGVLQHWPRNSSPRVSLTHYATKIGGVFQPHLPLETPNTIYLCQSCKRWNWIALDDRISSFQCSCPDCMRTSHLSLGRKLALRSFLKPLVLGDLRKTDKKVMLQCGHALFLAQLLFERPMPPVRPTSSAD